jgi:predicted secreted protein
MYKDLRNRGGIRLPGEGQRGQFARVPRSSIIKIELPENPIAGYKWTRPVFDEVFLVLERDQFLPAEQTGIGAGGIRQFAFRANGVGQTAVRLMNKRPWENEEQAATTFTLTIRI